MKIISLILKIVFCWIYIPYLLLKMIFGSSSSSSSTSGNSSSSSTQGGSGGAPSASGIPLVSFKKGYDSKSYELGEVKLLGKDLQVQYKETGGSFKRVIINSGKKQSGPILVDWSKKIVG